MNWWHRKQIDHVWFLFVLLVIMFTVIFLNAIIARAGSCLTIDVPPGAVVSQYDGDTFDVFTFGSPSKVAIRVLGVDTPEIKTNQPGAVESKEFTRQWLAKGPFTVSTCGRRSFERIIGLVSRGESVLSKDLIDAGMGKKAVGGL